MSGESNPFIGEGVGKPTWPQRIPWTSSTPARAAVFKRGESDGYDPKPGDLRVDRTKRGESYVEVR